MQVSTVCGVDRIAIFEGGRNELVKKKTPVDESGQVGIVVWEWMWTWMWLDYCVWSGYEMDRSPLPSLSLLGRERGESESENESLSWLALKDDQPFDG